jgi:hypothetical protein
MVATLTTIISLDMKYLWIFAFCLSFNPLSAQFRSLIHLDKSFYVSGEIIWYKVYLPASAAGKEVSVYTCLLDAKGAIVADQFVQTKRESFCFGQFEIPLDLPTGMYALHCSATNSAFEKDLLVQAPVPIFNDLLPLPKELSSSQPLIDQNASFEKAQLGAQEALKIAIKKGPSNGEDWQIIVSDQSGNPVSANASVSIADEALCGASAYPLYNLYQGDILPANVAWLGPMYRSGKAMDEALQPYTLTMIANDIELSHIFYTQPDQNGRFSLELPEYQGQRNIQLLHMDGKIFKLNGTNPYCPENCPCFNSRQGCWNTWI